MRLILALLFLLPSVAWAETSQFILDRNPTMFLDPATADTERGPIVHLTMDDNAASTVVLNKANAALPGTANRNTDAWSTASGKIGRGFDFYNGGTADRVDLGSDVIGVLAASVCAWVNPRNYGGGGYGRIVDNGKLLVNLDLANTRVNVQSDGSTVAYSGAITAGSFVHVCATRTAAGVTNIYLNAVLSGAANQSSGSPVGGTTNLNIGNRAANDRYFDGLMDDVRIYDYALTPNQIRKIYNAGAGHQRLASSRHQMALDATGAVMGFTEHKGIEFFQSTAASRPTLTLLNGRRVLSFDGSNDFLTSDIAYTSVFANNTKTLISVVKPRSISAVNASFLENAGTFNLNRGENNFRFNHVDAAGTVVFGLGTLVANRTYIGRVTHDGTLLRGASNGVQVTPVSSGRTIAGTNPVRIGGRDAATLQSDVDIGPIATFNRVLPESDLLRIDQGLAKEYAVSLAAATAEVSCDAYIRSLTPTLWLDSGDLSTITKDANNKVSEWRSKVGAVTFVQATAGNQPVWTGDGVDFTRASAHFLSSTSKISDVYAAGAKSFIAVVKPKVVNVNQNIMSSYNPITNGLLLYFNSTNYRIQHYAAAYDLTGTGLTVAAGGRYIVEMSHDGTNISARLNGGTAVSAASGNSHANLLNSTIQLASNGVGGDAFDGTIMEVAARNLTWTADQFARVRSCLGQKHGVTF